MRWTLMFPLNHHRIFPWQQHGWFFSSWKRWTQCFPKNQLKRELNWPQNKRPLSFCPSQMNSCPGNLAAVLHGADIRLPACTLYIRLHFWMHWTVMKIVFQGNPKPLWWYWSWWRDGFSHSAAWGLHIQHPVFHLLSFKCSDFPNSWKYNTILDKKHLFLEQLVRFVAYLDRDWLQLLKLCFIKTEGSSAHQCVEFFIDYPQNKTPVLSTSFTLCTATLPSINKSTGNYGLFKDKKIKKLKNK